MASLVIATLISGCATDGQNKSDSPSLLENTKNVMDSAKKSTQSLFQQSGDKNPVINGLAPQYKANIQAVGVDKDLMNRRALTYGFIDAPELASYMNNIRNKLQKVSGVTGVPGAVYVAADMAVNAEATLDGNIYINWGILKYMRNEDEVAAVIAHELAHLLLAHHDSNLVSHLQRKSQWFQQAGVVATVAIRKSTKNQLASQISTSDFKNGEVTQLQNVQLLMNLTSKVINPSWQRGQEREADLLGSDLLVKAGYNPDAMLNILSVISQSVNQAKTEPDVRQLLSHALNVATNDNKQSQASSIIESMAIFFGNDHPDPEKRMEDVSNYLAKHYDETQTTSPFKEQSWYKLTHSKGIKKLVESYDGAFSAKKLLDHGKVDEAYKVSKATVNGAKKDAYPAYIYASTLTAKNRSKEAEPILAETLNSKEPSGMIYRHLADTYALSGRNKDALKVVNLGYEKLDKPPQFLPLMIRYQRLNGNTSEANKLASNCGFNFTEYRDDCNAELNPN